MSNARNPHVTKTHNPSHIPYLDPSALGGLGPEQVIEKMRRADKGVRPEDWSRAFPDQPAELFSARGDLERVRAGDGTELWRATPIHPERDHAAPPLRTD